MASEVVGVPVQDLVCSLCLDVVKNATLLSCGHTFCRGCLEAYDKQHHLDHIVCPVCRKTTNLGKNRVAGLASNFLALGFQDELHKIAPSQSFCPLHTNVHNDIFCEDCKEFICLTCFIDSHKDHKIKKKEELEVALKEKRDSLIRESEMREAQIEESVKNAEQHRIDIHCHFSKIEKEIQDKFAKTVTILQQKEETLLNELGSIRKGTENHLVVRIAFQRQAIEHIKQGSTILKGYTGKKVGSDALIKTQYLQCSELEKSLKRSTDEAAIVRLKQKSESTRFRPSDEKLLSLGHIEVGVKETSNSEQVKTATGVKRKLEQPPAARKRVHAQSLTIIPAAPAIGKSLKLVRRVGARGMIIGMAAPSKNAVVVGYGWSRPGSDRFSVSGEKTQHLKSEGGKAFDIAFLTDGRSVVSHHDDKLRVYNTNRHSTDSTGMIYTCKEGGYYIRLCVDQNDCIYAVNGNPEIYIFRGMHSHPQRVVPVGDIKPDQICVTKTGALITSGWDNNILSTVTVFDREGHVGSYITASDSSEYLYATVDNQDRVLVAMVRHKSDVFTLTRYTLQSTILLQQVAFNELKLPCTIDLEGSCCCMTSLEIKLIGFANNQQLYFIELPE